MFDRNTELRALFSRLTTGESVAIVGQPNTGKSLLLSQVADPKVRAKWLPNHDQIAVVKFDGNQLPNNITANIFWQKVFDILIAESPPFIRNESALIVKSGDYGTFSLERFFRKLGKNHQRVALLVDHVGHFLSLPKLATFEMLGMLRSISSRSGGLTILIAGRRRVAALNRQTATLNKLGSPFFNIFQEIRLGALKEDETRRILIDRYGEEFGGRILSVTGRDPYLISLVLLSDQIPTETADLMSKLQKPAFDHFELAYKFLDELEPTLLSVLGIKSTSDPLIVGEVNELIWRGWLNRESNDILHPGSLLLESWFNTLIKLKHILQETKLHG